MASSHQTRSSRHPRNTTLTTASATYPDSRARMTTCKPGKQCKHIPPRNSFICPKTSGSHILPRKRTSTAHLHVCEPQLDPRGRSTYSNCHHHAAICSIETSIESEKNARIAFCRSVDITDIAKPCPKASSSSDVHILIHAFWATGNTLQPNSTTRNLIYHEAPCALPNPPVQITPHTRLYARNTSSV